MENFKKHRVQICVVGWHFFRKIYKQISKSSLDIHIVSHRYNDMLDKYNLKYSIIENVGREFHAYDYYIKNIWDKKSNVIFMHDDIEIEDFEKVFKGLLEKTIGLDFSYILGKKTAKYKSSGERSMYFSKKLIKLFLTEYNGIWYDVHNKGYTFGYFEDYDSKIYTPEYAKYRLKEGIDCKASIKALIKKYKLKSKNIVSMKMLLCRRGGIMNKHTYKTILNDNSIFGRNSDNNILEDIATQEGTDKCRDKHYYTKWYDFYFSSIRNDCLNILEIGVLRGESLNMWRKYFNNSTIYGIEKNKNYITNKKIFDEFKIFIGDQTDNHFLNKVCNKVPIGFDIIIDDGSHITNDQVETFEYLFDKLNPGGIYVIEDLHTSYNGKFQKEPKISAVNYLKDKIDNINYQGRFKFNNFEHLVRESENISKYERLISGMSFHAGICFIFKRFCK